MYRKAKGKNSWAVLGGLTSSPSSVLDVAVEEGCSHRVAREPSAGTREGTGVEEDCKVHRVVVAVASEKAEEKQPYLLV
jgi:hypothetical protein